MVSGVSGRIDAGKVLALADCRIALWLKNENLVVYCWVLSICLAMTAKWAPSEKVSSLGVYVYQ